MPWAVFRGEKARTFLGSSGDARCWRLENRSVKARREEAGAFWAFAPRIRTLSGSLLFRMHIFNIGIFAKVAGESPLEVENIVGHSKA